MQRLIDANKLKAEFIGKRYGTQAIEYVIDQQPTVDAEPVIRCKDCEFYDEMLHQCTREIDWYTVHDNDYCSLGERKDAEIN